MQPLKTTRLISVWVEREITQKSAVSGIFPFCFPHSSLLYKNTVIPEFFVQNQDKHSTQRQYKCFISTGSGGDLLVKPILVNFAGANQTVSWEHTLPRWLGFALQAQFLAVLCLCVAFSSAASWKTHFCPKNTLVHTIYIHKDSKQK